MTTGLLVQCQPAKEALAEAKSLLGPVSLFPPFLADRGGACSSVSLQQPLALGEHFWALSMVAASFSAPRQEATAGPCDWPRSPLPPPPPPPPAPHQAPQAHASRPVSSLGSREAHPLSLLGQSRSWSCCGAWAGPAVQRKPEGLSPHQPA